jgi:hypothetical protein
MLKAATRSDEAALPGTPDEVIEFFDAIALQRPDRDGRIRPGWIRKWTTAATLRTRGMGAISHRDDLATTATRLTTLTRLPFRYSGNTPEGAGEILVYYYSSNEMRRLYRGDGTLCMTRSDGRRGVIHHAELRIGNKHADCVDHELMHAIGFDNHWNRRPSSPPVRSVLAPRFGPDRAKRFSAWDAAAIRILYHPRMRPRMRRDEALREARAIVDDLYQETPEPGARVSETGVAQP